MPTTFQGRSLTALDITLLTSTVILRELLRDPERLQAHGQPAAVTAAHCFVLCTSLELCLSLVHPDPQHRLEQSPWGCGVVGLWGCGAGSGSTGHAYSRGSA